MANKEDNNIEPEMPAISGSEIEGIVDVGVVSADGVARPVFVNQFDEQEEKFLALTIEDSKRLHKFLEKVIPYLEEHKARILQ